MSANKAVAEKRKAAAVRAALSVPERLFEAQEKFVLRDRTADAYIAMLARLLKSSRLNRHFPDRHGIAGLYRMMGPHESHFQYDSVEIGMATGLPAEKAVTRVQADRSVAPDVVEKELARSPQLADARVPESKPGDDRFERNYRYHRTLLQTPILPTFFMDLQLRRVEPETQTASFITVLDRFDLSEEMFCRYTIDLAHTAMRWSRPLVELEGDDLRYTRKFESRIAKTAAHDSELAFLLLSDLKGVSVESVTRTRIGPLVFAGTAGPAPLQKLVDEHPGDFILSLTTDRAAIDIGTDSSGDPLSHGYREFLTPEVRVAVERRRIELGYHVRRDRKFVCTRAVKPALKAYLKEQGTPCVVYEVRR
jgi:hypothetical protein